MYSVIVDFQDDYGYSWLESKDLTNQEVVFKGSYDQCHTFYIKKKWEQDKLDAELNALENQTYEG